MSRSHFIDLGRRSALRLRARAAAGGPAIEVSQLRQLGLPETQSYEAETARCRVPIDAIDAFVTALLELRAEAMTGRGALAGRRQRRDAREAAQW